MTESSPESAPSRDGRVFARYHDLAGTGEVSLPGSLDARPSIVSDGDVFSIPVDQVDQLVGDRFEAVSPPEQTVEFVDPSETIEQLLGSLPDDVRETAPKSPKDAVVAFVEDYRRTHPPVPVVGDGMTGGDADEENEDR